MKSLRGCFLVLPALLALQPLAGMTDEFDTDPTLNPEWEWYAPVAGVTTLTEDGIFRATVPAGVIMDHWAGVDNATQLRRTDLAEDFKVETRILFVGAGDDPENPIWPPPNEAYHTVLTVGFGATDVYYWGFYGGTRLIVERSGANNLCNLDPGIQEVSLQIKKTGTLYSFSYRAEDSDDWILVCTQVKTETPVFTGLMFKTWGNLSLAETFDFDYFKIDPFVPEVPAVTAACALGDPDQAWLGMPYARSLAVTGYPVPDLTVKTGPAGLTVDSTTGLVSGWTPDALGTVAIEISATNSQGTASLAWQALVSAASEVHDEEFDDDPTNRPEYWELYQPQTGITYSILDEEDNSWWRLEVPAIGDLGLNWDTWVDVDRAPQLRHPVEPDEDFLVETRVRLVPDALPAFATDPFLMGLMVNFDGAWDLVTWTAGGERLVPVSNVFAERSGANNLANSYANGLYAGVPVCLRMEKRCQTYSFFFREDSQTTWTLAGSYRAAETPLSVGLVMKTWGGGAAFTVDFDYFSFVKVGPLPSFTMTPSTGPEPLAVAFDASASQPSSGTITGYEWDFGDGETGTGQTTNHTFDDWGTYTVKLTITDSTGNKASLTKELKVDFSSGDVSPWTSVDVGDPLPVTAGGARMDGTCIDLFAGGRDISSRADQFHFVYQSLKGDCSVEARLAAAEWPTGAKVGVMLREDLTPGSRCGAILFVNLAAGGKYQWVHRDTAGGSMAFPKTSTDTFAMDARVRIVRTGAEIVVSYSPDGATWTELGKTSALELPETVLGGLVGTANDLSGTGQALEVKFCDISVTGGSTVTENCSNDVDDDGDQLTDCDDPDCAGAPECSGKTEFHRGDANADGTLNITDGIFVLNFLFLGGPRPPCLEAANPNDDPQLNITDGIYILNFLFLGGPPPAAPGPVTQPCGPDPEGSPTDLGCESYTKC